MPNITEIRDSRNKLLRDAQEILLASPDAEKRTSANKMLTDADLLEADITSLERIAKIEAEERSRTTPPRGVVGQGTEAEQRVAVERKAFSDYIRYGVEDRSSMKEHRDVTTGTAGFLVPQSYYPILTEAMKFYGNVLNVVTNYETTDGSPMKYSVDDDTANSLVVLGEAIAANETDNAVTGGIISTDFCSTGVVKVSLAVLQDSAFSLDNLIRNNFGKRYYRGLSKWVTDGNASNVNSLVAAAAPTVTSIAPTGIAWADIAATFASLDPAYESMPNTAWMMGVVTRGALLGITDTLGRPLYIPAVTSESFDTILGKRVIINPFMSPIAATNATITYGDHGAYLLRTVSPGLSIMRLSERFMDTGEIGYIGFTRVGGALLQGSVPPIVKLTMHA